MIYICKLISPLATGLSLGDIEEGKLVTLDEGGQPIQFYVSKQDYESGLNGAGRTLLVRKDCYDQRKWNSTNVNAYATSDIDAWMNSTYKALFPEEIQTAMGTTKFYYTPGNGNWTVGTLERSLFLLSMTELGASNSAANVEGNTLPISDLLILLNGSIDSQHTRTPATNGTDGNWSFVSGGPGVWYCTTIRGSRPCLTLPADFKFKESEVA